MTNDTTSWAELYGEHVAALSALAGSLSPADAALTVPASPEWSVLDVYAHLAGGPSDIAAGRTEGAPGPDWTARHVAERQALPLADLVAEMQGNVAGVAASLAGGTWPGTVWDVAVHHADLHEALGRGVLPDGLWEPVLASAGPRVLDALPASATAGVAPYELFRGVFSRRSRRQVAAWSETLSSEQVDAIGIFGPRDDDQPVPG